MTVPPATLNLAMYQGDHFTETFEQFDADGVTPLDRTGYSYEAQIRAQHESSDPLVSFTINTSSLATGVIVLSLTAAQTADLPRTAVWDLEETSPAAVVTTLLKGTVTVEREVTR